MRVVAPLEQCWHEVPGGTARTSIDLVRALMEVPDVEVVGVSAWHRGLPEDPWKPPVRVERLPLPRRVLYEAWHGLRRPPVEWATGRADVVHVLGGAVVGHRAPLVVTVHDLAFLHHPEMFTRHGVRFFERALELTRREAGRVLVPSSATLEDCVRAGIERDRLRHVPWGIAVTEVDDGAVAAARRRFGIDGDYVLFVGTREPRKNLTRLLEAWRLVDRGRDLDRELQLVVVGPSGWGEVLDEGSGTPPNVSIIGFVDDPTRDALYAGAVASVYPSLFEGFGLPVLEAMASGCPVITSAGTATEELVDPATGVVVDPTDVDAMAGAVVALVADPDRRAAMSEAGRARAATYTWERAAAATVEAYEEVR